MAIKTSAVAMDCSLVAREADADKHCLAGEPGECRMLRCNQGQSGSGHPAVFDGAQGHRPMGPRRVADARTLNFNHLYPC
jgi:hypothetical protein